MLLLGAVFLVGLMLYASVAKMVIMMAVQEKPEAFNPNSIDYHYRNNQALSYAHILIGVVFLLTGAFQLLPYFRKNYQRIHRRIGRLFLTTSLLVSASAIVMAVYAPFGNWIEVVTTLVFGSYLLICTWWAYHFARQRKIALHREWVYRVYFVALAIATIRIVAGIGMTITGNSLKNMLGISFAIAFILHTVIVECWIRWSRK